jgi:2-keto-4-pentenoate hydratase/2-oxohepta-3-ene-1,7-dioic acid hydratase in catechol pathway
MGRGNMQIVRFLTKDNQIQYGWLQNDLIGKFEGLPFGDHQRCKPEIPLMKVKLLAPHVPGKIICIGRNYLEHVKEVGAEPTNVPIIFLKPPSSVIGPGEVIQLPPQSTQVEHEGELAVYIGKRGRWIPVESAKNHILGYTIANDITARDLQRRDGQWTRGKGFDTFCPVGPWIETDFNPFDALITTHVNGQLRQMASTRDMIFSIHQLIAFISSVMTIETGDLILTGTPAGLGPLVDGDSVKVAIEGIGELINPVEKAKENPVYSQG